MYAVFAMYPFREKILVGYASNRFDVDGLINDCITYNGEEKLKEMGIRFVVEFMI